MLGDIPTLGFCCYFQAAGAGGEYQAHLVMVTPSRRGSWKHLRDETLRRHCPDNGLVGN